MAEEIPAPSGSAIGFRATLAVLLITVLAAVAYSFHEHNVAKHLAAQNSAISTTLNTTRGQLSALTAQVNATDANPLPEKEAKDHSPIYRKPLTAAAARHRIDDPQWKKIQGQLDDQGRQIESTRQDLASTRTELQGSIAKTHDEIVLLEKKGERNYYEFDLDKTGQFQRQGPVSVRLRKANTKHEYADLELLVDDLKLSKKHVNVYEPVVFYPGEDKLPVELVINNISKNHIHGYVSEPKYRTADIEAMANSGTGNQGAKPSPARQRLELPKTEPGH